MNLRFIIRDGKKILQYGTYENKFKHVPSSFDPDLLVAESIGVFYTWKDIPLCDEDTGEEIKE